jgi:hypothetical protein
MAGVTLAESMDGEGREANGQQPWERDRQITE